MKIVTREDVTTEDYREILDTETHHNHVIIEDEHGTLRWEENPDISLLLKKINLNDLMQLLGVLGFGKNSEVVRKLYRDMGYSLGGYWEVFYWNWNNEDVDDYSPVKELTEERSQKVESLINWMKGSLDLHNDMYPEAKVNMNELLSYMSKK